MPVFHVFTSPQPDVADPTLVRPSNWNSSHLATMVDIISLGGNTAGALADITGTAFFAGGNNITLSQNMNSVTISAGAVGGGNFTAGVSTGGNTSGDTGVVTGRLVLAGGNNVTLSQATAAGGLVTVTISGASQTTHAHTDAFNILSAGTQIAGTQQTVIFSDSNGLAFGMSNNSIITGSYSQSTHAHTDVFNRISAGTQIAGTQQTVIFSDSNGVAFGMSNNSIVTASYSQSTHAHTDAHNIIAAGTQTANTTGTVVFSNSNGIAFGMSNNSIVTASYTVPTVPAQFTGGFSTQGNTAGDTALVTGRLLLVGGANITLSGSSNAGSLTLTVIGGAGAAGNTGSISAGTTRATLGEVVFSDSNGMAFGVNGQTVTASYSQSTHTHSFLSAGMSTEGNTSGTTGLVAERIVFVGGDNITLSQSVNAQSATLTISAAAGAAGGTLSHWDNFLDVTTAGSQQSNTLASIQRFQLPVNLAMSNILIPVSMSIQTTNNTSTAFMDLSITVVIYTRNVSTLSSIASFSNTMTQTWRNNTTGSVTGVVGITATGNATTLTPGNYWLAVHISTTNTGTGANSTALNNFVTMILAGTLNTAFATMKDWAVGSAGSQGILSGVGILSTNATRDTIAFSDYAVSSSRAPFANLAIALRNQTFLF